MKRRPPCSAFTLIEMLVVMVVIAILTGLILSLNGLVQSNAARHRAETEIKAMSAACEQYKADNGGYPQGPSSGNGGPTPTDKLDPNPQCSTAANPSKFSTFDPAPNDYWAVSAFLWQQLSGHLNDLNPAGAPTGTNYAGDLFKPTMLGGLRGGANGQISTVYYIMDPFGNAYGYSTAGLYADQLFRAAVLNPANGQSGTSTVRQTAGFNPTFDMWSTGGATTNNSTATVNTPSWVKNW